MKYKSGCPLSSLISSNGDWGINDGKWLWNLSLHMFIKEITSWIVILTS